MILWQIITPIIAGIVVLFLVVFIFKVCYRKCPPNRAMVVTGPRGAKTYIGRAKLVIPFFQRVDFMSLENIQVDFVSKSEIPTQDAINIRVDAVANMSIDQDPEVLKIAASKFLGRTTTEIRVEITPILEGNIREIISQIPLTDLIRGDKKVLAEKITENVSPNLRDMGLKLTTFNIQNFSDQNGVIDNLGIENTEQIKKDASIAAARAKAEVAVAQAEAQKQANDAEIAAQTEIAIKENELAIKRAELKEQQDIKIAKAEAAKGIEAENQRKFQEIAEADANLARQEKKIELGEREVKITERKLEAEIKKKAEADKFAAQQEADAELYTEQRNAEAEKYKRQQDADAQMYEAQQSASAKKASAEAERFAKEQDAEAIRAAGLAEADAIRAKGNAEADAAKAKLVAEAEGLKEKAEAMALYGEAAQKQMVLDAAVAYFDKLPDIASAIAEGFSSVDSIKIFGGDAGQLTGQIINGLTQVNDGLSESMGFDLKSLLVGLFGAKALGGDNVAVHVNDTSATDTTTSVSDTPNT